MKMRRLIKQGYTSAHARVRASLLRRQIELLIKLKANHTTKSKAHIKRRAHDDLWQLIRGTHAAQNVEYAAHRIAATELPSIWPNHCTGFRRPPRSTSTTRHAAERYLIQLSVACCEYKQTAFGALFHDSLPQRTHNKNIVR